MKRVLLMLAFFVASCAPRQAPPTPIASDPSLTSHSLPTADWSMYTPSTEAFTAGPACPHMCWLEINPGVTPASDAYKILKASDQIDQKTLQATSTGIVATWFTEKSRKLNSSVYLLLENDLVKSISFDGFAPFKVKNLTKLLGDPYGILIDMEVTDGVMYMPYETYYSAQTVLLGSEAADQGPNPDDVLTSLSMNISYDTKLFHSWLGYGHLKEYFAGKSVHQHTTNP